MTPYYDHGGITIYHGDCREILPGLGRFDLLATSPPYLSQRDYTSRGFAWDEVVPPALAMANPTTQAQAFVNLGIVTRDGRVVCYWDRLIADMERRSWKLTGWYTWDKGQSYPGKFNQFGPSHEWIFHFAQDGVAPHRFIPCRQAGVKRTTAVRARNGTVGRPAQDSPKAEFKALDSVLRFPPINASSDPPEHPAEQSPQLAAALVRSYPGLVLDPFMGSGTTLRAAKDLGRRAIGIEIEERYCEIAAKRLAQEVLFG